MANIRENFSHYIGVTPQEEQEMLQFLSLNQTKDLFEHIPKNQLLGEMQIPPGETATAVKEDLSKLAKKNHLFTSFIGDGLQQFSLAPVVPLVCQIRGLTTAYTPYQPERSQGTLQSLWIYQNLIAKITGFEAINASLYERSTCLFEAISCACRISKKNNE